MLLGDQERPTQMRHYFVSYLSIKMNIATKSGWDLRNDNALRLLLLLNLRTVLLKIICII